MTKKGFPVLCGDYPRCGAGSHSVEMVPDRDDFEGRFSAWVIVDPEQMQDGHLGTLISSEAVPIFVHQEEAESSTKYELGEEPWPCEIIIRIRKPRGAG